MARSSLARWVLLVVAIPLLSACEDKGSKPSGDALTLSDALTAISDRAKLVRDYRYVGSATNLAGGHKIEFNYMLKQPRMIRADVSGMESSFVFDGKSLAILDHGQKKVLRQDLSKTDENTVMASLHQFFGDYVCEGWKPPVTRPEKGKNSAVLQKGEDGSPRWVLITHLDDDVLKEVRYTLRAPTGDFLKKEFIAKDGSVFASTTVLKEHKDERSKLSFPTSWEHKSAQRNYRVELKDVVINQGLTQEPFEITVPDGYTSQEIGRQP